jgi:hypothetical protein
MKINGQFHASATSFSLRETLHGNQWLQAQVGLKACLGRMEKVKILFISGIHPSHRMNSKSNSEDKTCRLP